ncbi:MAG: hypothetical protein SF053_16275 [Bacteroidia bacterium]|nr:hypothetical protein [Bacteroidia bacterium]
MRTLWIYGMIGLLLLQSFNRVGLVAYYYLNQAYITDVFCVNKSRPELKCNGQCYLMQKIRQADEREARQPQTTPEHLGKEIFVVCSLEPVQPEAPAQTILPVIYPPEMRLVPSGIRPAPVVPPPRA